MSPNAKHLFENALGLSIAERADLAAKLIDSLDDTFDDNVSVEWEVEIQRRMQDLVDGRVQTVPWSEVRRQMVEAIDGRRND